MNTRMEHDTMGEIAVPAEHHWGAQTQRSLENFKIGGQRQPQEIIPAFAYLKEACAQANADCGKLTQLYPLPDGVCDTLKHYDTILFAEDTVRTGGIGEQLGFAMQQCGWQGEFLLHAVDNSHLLHANVPELRKDQQLDAAALCADILNALKEKQA